MPRSARAADRPARPAPSEPPERVFTIWATFRVPRPATAAERAALEAEFFGADDPTDDDDADGAA